MTLRVVLAVLALLGAVALFALVLGFAVKAGLEDGARGPRPRRKFFPRR